MSWLMVPLALLAALSWLSAVFHWILALSHLSGRTPAVVMFVRSLEMFNTLNFTVAGQQHQRRFVQSFGAFIATIVLMVLVSVTLR